MHECKFVICGKKFTKLLIPPDKVRKGLDLSGIIKRHGDR